MTNEEFNEMVNEEYRGGTVIVNITALFLIPVIILLVLII